MSTILEVSDLKKIYHLGSFFSEKRTLRAVDGVSFRVNTGETFCVVGESGCGKTTLGKSILRLVEPSSASYIRFCGEDILHCGKKKLQKLRRQMQIIFQDPISVLNPTKTIGSILKQPLLIHKIVKKDKVDEKIAEVLREVGLVPSEDFVERFQFELSGGQRQRVAIAKAVSLRPKFVVCDEPVSHLDISVQGLILGLLRNLQEKYDIAYLFITHDLNVVRSIADRIMIMYLGKVVEVAATKPLYDNPVHPYTKGLLKATPTPNPRRSLLKEHLLKGEAPSPIDIPTGCRFYSRCTNSLLRCKEAEPELIDIGDGHLVACHNL